MSILSIYHTWIFCLSNVFIMSNVKYQLSGNEGRFKIVFDACCGFYLMRICDAVHDSYQAMYHCFWRRSNIIFSVSDFFIGTFLHPSYHTKLNSLIYSIISIFSVLSVTIIIMTMIIIIQDVCIFKLREKNISFWTCDCAHFELPYVECGVV